MCYGILLSYNGITICSNSDNNELIIIWFQRGPNGGPAAGSRGGRENQYAMHNQPGGTRY